MNRRAAAFPMFLTLAAACDTGPQPVPPPPVPAQADCPDGFGPLDDILTDGCYRVIEDASWVRGEERCEDHVSQDEMAHLVVVDRLLEHEALSNMAPATAMGIWTGRLQRSRDGDYRNINYVEVETEYFGTGEPNDYGQDCDDWFGGCTGRPGYGDERCVEYSYETGMWNDEPCERLQTVVCEWDGVGPYQWGPYDDED